MARRIYLPLVGLAAFVVLALVNLPLSLALNVAGLRDAGIIWSSVGGTVWNGTLGGVTVQGYPVGTIEQRTGFLPLFTGRASTQLTIRGSAINGEGRVTLAGDTVTFTDLAALADLSAFGVYDAMEAPMRGMLRVETGRLRISDERCLEGSADIWTDTLVYTARQYGVEDFPLAGTAVCSPGGPVVVDLAGEGDGRAITVEASLDPSLDYLAEVSATGITGDLADGLMLYGFERRGDALILAQRGNLLDTR